MISCSSRATPRLCRSLGDTDRILDRAPGPWTQDRGHAAVVTPDATATEIRQSRMRHDGTQSSLIGGSHGERH
jgi:hypothetical protein